MKYLYFYKAISIDKVYSISGTITLFSPLDGDKYLELAEEISREHEKCGKVMIEHFSFIHAITDKGEIIK